MNSELRDYIRKCDVCQTYRLKQAKETLKSHDVPTRPWVKIGTDLFCFSGNDYLITVDYYSRVFFRNRETLRHIIKDRHQQIETTFCEMGNARNRHF